MKKLNVEDLKPGMTTIEDVYTLDGKLVLPKGLVLTPKAIVKLDFYAIHAVKVDDAISASDDSVEEEIPLPSPSQSTKVKSSQAFHEFTESFTASVNTFKNLFGDVIDESKPLDTVALLEDMQPLLHSSTGGQINVFDMLHNMRDYDDLTYVHCVNVSLICNTFARWLRLSEEDIETATLCGLLHDIGKIGIPDAIIKKPGKLTDEEFALVKTHPVKGYHLLLKCAVDEHVQKAALMHHERCDGTGYPLGLHGDKIDRFAKMVSIADVYDAMTAARVYRGSLCPFEVVDMMEAEGLQKYDVQYILTFLECVVNTYLLYRVRLSNGIEGDIVFINKQHLSRPIIQTDSEIIDLSVRPELQILCFV
ncbi:MAG: HD-GYP domain-containing protein [Lachnospiraceae bacterium]